MTTPNQPLGAVAREDGRWVLRYERTLAHAPDKVWRAITESEHLAHWMPCNIVGERRAGATIELPFWPAHVARYGIATPTLHGSITVWDPPSVFEWTWETDLLRWELEPIGGATLLRFTTHIDADDDGPGPAQTAAGYHVCLDNLADLLDTGTTSPLVDADVSPWERRYEQAVGQAS